MTRPPKDPNPVASTSGVANSQGQAIFTGDWNSLIDNYVEAQSNTMKLERVGKASVTIATNTMAGATLVALSPVLPDAIGNYIAQGSVNPSSSQVAWSGHAQIVSTAQIAVRAFRSPNTVAISSSATGVTVAGGDLTSVSGMALTPIPNPTTVSDLHGGSNSFFDHQHLNQNHPVTDPLHTHTIGTMGFSGAALTVNVDWMIIHI